MYQYFNLFDRINDLQEILENDFFSWSRENRRANFPYINLKEEENALKIDVLLPGVKNDDIELTIKEKVLIIEGEKKNSPANSEDINVIREERAYGKFHKAISLPVNVEADKAKAVFKNGILSITLEKKEQEKARKISIQ